MRCLSFVCLLAIVAALPDTQAAPAPKSRFSKPAIIDAGTEKNIAGILERVADCALPGVHENKKVADLPIVRQQKDLDAWLKKNLRTERIPRTNRVRVSFREGTQKDQVAIINAAVDEYLKVFVGRRRASLTRDLKIGKGQLANPAVRRRMTIEQVQKGEKSLKEIEEYIRTLPMLFEPAKAR